jgi:hypothetical protein
MNQVKCILFNLGDPNQLREYEALLNRERNEEIHIRDTKEAWGNKAEGVLFKFVEYEILE